MTLKLRIVGIGDNKGKKARRTEMLNEIIQKQDASVMDQGGSQGQGQKWSNTGNILKIVLKRFHDNLLLGVK